VQVLDLLLRGEAGAKATIRPRLEPLAIGVESRVPLGDSQGRIELFVCGGGELRGFFGAAIAGSSSGASVIAVKLLFVAR
jgi:hypothetical protein